MPLPFNRSLDLKLIQLVKHNTALYDTEAGKHLDFDEREVIWHKIGDELNRSGQVCKARWVNIRDMMRRKQKERLLNPGKRITKYKYETELDFTRPFFKDCTLANDEFAEYLEEETTDPVEMPDAVFVASDQYEDTKNVQLIRKDSFLHESVIQNLTPNDPLNVFLMTIGATLSKFSPYYLNQAKSKIFEVVQEYELQQIVHKDGEPSSSADKR